MAQSVSNLLPGLGGSGYTNTQPINWGAYSPAPAPKPLATPTMTNVAAQYPNTFSSSGSFSSPPVQGVLSAPKPTQQMTTPSGIPVTGNPGTWAGVQQSQSQVPTYPGLVGALSQTSQQGNPAVGAAQQGLMQSAQSNPLQSGGAYDAYSKSVQDLANFKQGLAKQYGNIENSAIPLEFQQGREQVLARQAASQQDALQQAVTQAQQALGYGIQEQGQQQAGFNQAGALGNTAQGLVQSGLTGAAGLAQPQLAGFNQQSFNPLTSQFGGASGMNDAVALQVQKLQNHTTDPQSAMSALSAYGQPAINALQQALGPGYNFNTATGISSAQGTQAQTQQQYQSALQQGQNLQTQLTDLITTFGLNPNDLNAMNAGLQKIAQNTSSPQYQQLSNLVTEIANTYSQILTPPGGSVTDTSRSISSGMLDATAKGTSILSVMQGLDQQAQAKISGVPVNSTSGTSGGTSGSVGSSWDNII